ncbi:unnamed protein product, partial [Rotaria sp. Silwood1]
TLGLQQLFVENNDVRHLSKKFGYLALIPEQFVIAEFEKLQTDSPDSINATKYFLIIKRTYDLLL